MPIPYSLLDRNREWGTGKESGGIGVVLQSRVSRQRQLQSAIVYDASCSNFAVGTLVGYVTVSTLLHSLLA